MEITKDNFYLDTIGVFQVIQDQIKLQEPDFVSYTGPKCVSFDPFNDFDCVDQDENLDGEIIGAVNLSCGEFNEDIYYELIDTFTGRHGDTGYLFRQQQQSSKYWYTDKGVYRLSAHWGEVASCQWNLNIKNQNGYGVLLGFCEWKNFKKNIN